MSDAKKVRAAAGDLVLFTVGGRWILAEVLEANPAGHVQVASNSEVRFELGEDKTRWIFPKQRMSQPEFLRAYVRTNLDNSFETLKEVTTEVYRWVRAGSPEIGIGTGENILEELT